MLYHSVIFKFKASISNVEKHEFFNAVNKLAMIEGVHHFETLKQTSLKNEYEFGLAMVFDNTEAYQKYNAHPEHSLFIQKYWLTMVDGFLEIDYEPITDIASFKF